MNTPLIIFNQIFPQEIINNIQIYLPPNDIVINALKDYYDILHEAKILNDEYIFETIVYPNCYCSNCPDNGHHKLFKRRDCSPCFEYETKEYSGDYASDEYKMIIRDNPQYKKIAHGEYNSEDDYDDMYWYDDRNIWLEWEENVLNSSEYDNYL